MIEKLRNIEEEPAQRRPSMTESVVAGARQPTLGGLHVTKRICYAVWAARGEQVLTVNRVHTACLFAASLGRPLRGRNPPAIVGAQRKGRGQSSSPCGGRAAPAANEGDGRVLGHAPR